MQFSPHLRGYVAHAAALDFGHQLSIPNHEKSCWGNYGAHFRPFSQQTFAESTPKTPTFTPKAPKVDPKAPNMSPNGPPRRPE